MAWFRTLISWIFLAIALICFVDFTTELYQIYKLETANEAQRLFHLWKRDLNLLKENKKLHPHWSRIREVVLIGGTPQAKDWIKEIGSPVEVTPSGDQRLEVLLLSWQDEGKEGAIIQYNLVDLPSGNMIWELGRTFTLKKAPSPKIPTNSTSPAPISESGKPSPKPSASPTAPGSR